MPPGSSRQGPRGKEATRQRQGQCEALSWLTAVTYKMGLFGRSYCCLLRVGAHRLIDLDLFYDLPLALRKLGSASLVALQVHRVTVRATHQDMSAMEAACSQQHHARAQQMAGASNAPSQTPARGVHHGARQAHPTGPESLCLQLAFASLISLDPRTPYFRRRSTDLQPFCLI